MASGTAAGVGFPSWLCAAVKTGTAQSEPERAGTEDWMIGFAPANHPQIAVAVVVPKQNVSSDGALGGRPHHVAHIGGGHPAGIGLPAVQRVARAGIGASPAAT